jgi:hypothetical protein
LGGIASPGGAARFGRGEAQYAKILRGDTWVFSAIYRYRKCQGLLMVTLMVD